MSRKNAISIRIEDSNKIEKAKKIIQKRTIHRVTNHSVVLFLLDYFLEREGTKNDAEEI